MSERQPSSTEWSKKVPVKFSELYEDFSEIGRMAGHGQAAVPGRIEWHQIQIGRNIFTHLRKQFKNNL